MKKIIALSVFFTAALFGNAFAADKLRVVTTTEDLAAVAREVAGDRAEVEFIAHGYQDPHFVDPKPSYLFMLRRADLLVAVGLELEVGWLPPLVQQCRNPKLLTPRGYLDASTGCDILERRTGPASRAEGDVHPQGNPHYWLDPANGAVIARNVVAKLSALSPGNAEYFNARRDDFLKRLDEAMKRWEGRAAKFKGVKVITYHRSWVNFSKRFGLDVVGYVEPLPGIPPSPAHTLETLTRLKTENIPLIIVEPYFDTKLPGRLATESGKQMLLLYPSVGGADDIRDYFALFERNLTLIEQALAKASKAK